jgi:outer membrane protein TolC
LPPVVAEPCFTLAPDEEEVDQPHFTLAPEEVGAGQLPWWQARVAQPLKPGAAPRPVDLEAVVLETLAHSAQVRVLTEAPLIRRQAICDAQSRFDVRAFMESKFVDTSEPVGSLLTTGGASRYVDQNMRYSAGIRKKLLTGGQFEVSQRIGYENSNSIYFVPPYQGTARLTVGFTQPLLNGAGRQYNESLIVIAQVETAAAREQMSRQLQTLLVDVHRGYWELHFQRSVLLQKRKLYDEAVAIRDELDARREVDVLGSQLVRAQAAVAAREAAIIRHETAIRNAEARLSALVNDPAWLAGQQFELIPAETPATLAATTSLQNSLVEAMQKRPEVNQASAEIRAASVRAEMACNELLPVLNLIMESYVSGLQGYTDIPAAVEEQFNTGRPTYSLGLVFEYPLGNRGANARLTQRRLEVRQLTNQLQALMSNIRAEVEIAVREVETSHREMISKRVAMQAEAAEIDYLRERWRLLPGDQQGAGVVLDDILRAQERLADAEMEFARAQMDYNMALVDLKRVTGTLLEWEAIVPAEMCEEGLPTLRPEKAAKQGSQTPSSIIAPLPAAGAPAIERLPDEATTTTRAIRCRPAPR